MKKRLVFLSLALLFFAAFGGTIASAQKQTGVKISQAKAVEPTAREAIKLVLANGDIPLSSIASCKSVGTTKSDKTILDYLIGVLAFQAEPESQNRIEFSFKPEKGKRNESVWVCDLIFSGKDGEETVYSNGVRFTMRNSDRRLLRESLMCIGTG